MKQFEMNNVDIHEFVKALDNCKGDVYLITDEGDRFNLRSKLSQLAGIMNLIWGGKIVNAKIYCSDLDDEATLFRFNLFGSDEDGAEVV
jgi:hypothetical protein